MILHYSVCGFSCAQRSCFSATIFLCTTRCQSYRPIICQLMSTPWPARKWCSTVLTLSSEKGCSFFMKDYLIYATDMLSGNIVCNCVCVNVVHAEEKRLHGTSAPVLLVFIHQCWIIECLISGRQVPHCIWMLVRLNQLSPLCYIVLNCALKI